MNINEIRTIARSCGVCPLPKTKLALVRAIQTGEGNFPCFATAYDNRCDQTQCRWRSDCFKSASPAATPPPRQRRRATASA